MKKIITELKNHKLFLAFIMVFILIFFYKIFDYIPNIWNNVNLFFSNIIKITMPIIMAGIISYILKPLVNLVDKLYIRIFLKTKIKDKPMSIIPERKFKKIRLLTVLTVLTVLVSVIVIILSFVVQPFLDSLKALIKELPVYVDIFTKFLANLEFDPNFVAQLTEKVTMFFNQNFSDLLNTSVVVITTFISNTGVFLFNLLVAIILSVYILRDKEKIGRFFSILLDLICSSKFAVKIKNFFKELDNIFGSYFTGVIVDAIFVGVSSFVITSLIKNPYAVIIGVLAGVSNVIPYVGPLIGALSALILGLPSGLSVALLGFLLLMLFQQIEGNLIQPKILGDFVGISPLIVIISLLIGGGLFGIVGILISSPVAGIISLYYKRYLKRKNIDF